MNTEQQNGWGKPTTKLRLELLKKYEGCCPSCGDPEWKTGERLQIHRIDAGGEYSLENCVPLCRKCHVNGEGKDRDQLESFWKNRDQSVLTDTDSEDVVYRSSPFFPQDRFTIFSNVILDEFMPDLSPNAWKILCLIIRRTVGWNRKSREISYNEIREGTGIRHGSTIKKSVNELTDRGLISVETGEDWDKNRYYLDLSFSPVPSAENEQERNPPSSKNELASSAENELVSSAENEQLKIKKRKDIERQEDEKESSSYGETESNNGNGESPNEQTGGTQEDSEAKQFYFKQFRRKRWATDAQRELFEEMESRFGSDVLIQAIRWAAVKGISDLQRIESAAKKMAKDHDSRTRERTRTRDAGTGGRIPSLNNTEGR